jgi:hypothetical protein
VARPSLFTGPAAWFWLSVGTLLFVVGGPLAIVRAWRDPASIPDIPHHWTRRHLEASARSAWRRSAPVCFAALSFAMLSILAGRLAVHVPALAVVEDAALALGVACVLLVPPLRLFNRPRLLVPPALRAEPGTVADRAVNRRRRRSHGPS